MYLPKPNVVDDREQLRAFVSATATGNLITVGADGQIDATLLPIIWDGERVIAHMAVLNDHWKRITDGSSALITVDGLQTYVSPAWYASKAEHGRVVPTWNYSAVHLRGLITVHHDPEWCRGMVTALTAKHEAGVASSWQLTDAPDRFIDGQLRAIVGVEMAVRTVEAKAKWSQNRPAADREGVIRGLTDRGNDIAAEHVRSGAL